jgi:hypothetical protein
LAVGGSCVRRHVSEDQLGTRKGSRRDQEGIKKGLRRDQERIKKGSRSDQDVIKTHPLACASIYTCCHLVAIFSY